MNDLSGFKVYLIEEEKSELTVEKYLPVRKNYTCVRRKVHV